MAIKVTLIRQSQRSPTAPTVRYVADGVESTTRA